MDRRRLLGWILGPIAVLVGMGGCNKGSGEAGSATESNDDTATNTKPATKVRPEAAKVK